MYTDNFHMVNDDEMAVEEAISNVVEVSSNAVCSTMGPDGKYFIIANGVSTLVTKDGVTVAKAIKFSDPFKETINKILTEAAIKTDDECGDGTTTTMWLTAHLYKVLKHVNEFRLHRKIDNYIKAVIDRLGELVIKNPDDNLLRMLALTTSNQDDAITDLVMGIKTKFGYLPEIETKDGSGVADTTEYRNGFPFSATFSNPQYSISGLGTESVYTDFVSYVLNDELNIEGSHEIATRLEAFDGKQLIIFCRSAQNDANAHIIAINRELERRGHKKIIVLQTNTGGSTGALLMGDLAVTLNTSIHNSVNEMFGSHVSDDEIREEFNRHIPSTSITVNSIRSFISVTDETVLEKIKAHSESIQKDVNGYGMGDRHSIRAKINSLRVRNLRGNMVTIYVGGETLSDIKERKDRVIDVIRAVQSGYEHGVLPGAGTSLHQAAVDVLSTYPREEICYSIREIRDVLSSIHVYFAADVGRFTPSTKIVNLATGEEGHPLELGVVDTAMASITALKGGFKTAVILSKSNGVLLGDKLNAIRLSN